MAAEGRTRPALGGALARNRYEEAVRELAEKFGTVNSKVAGQLHSLHSTFLRMDGNCLAHRPGDDERHDASWKRAAGIASPLVQALQNDVLPNLLACGRDRDARVGWFVELCSRLDTARDSVSKAAPDCLSALKSVCRLVTVPVPAIKKLPGKSIMRDGFLLVHSFLLDCAAGRFDQAVASVRPLFVAAFAGAKCAGEDSANPVALFRIVEDFQCGLDDGRPSTRSTPADAVPVSPDKVVTEGGRRAPPKRRRAQRDESPDLASAEPAAAADAASAKAAPAKRRLYKAASVPVTPTTPVRRSLSTKAASSPTAKATPLSKATPSKAVRPAKAAPAPDARAAKAAPVPPGPRFIRITIIGDSDDE